MCPPKTAQRASGTGPVGLRPTRGALGRLLSSDWSSVQGLKSHRRAMLVLLLMFFWLLKTLSDLVLCWELSAGHYKNVRWLPAFIVYEGGSG